MAILVVSQPFQVKILSEYLYYLAAHNQLVPWNSMASFSWISLKSAWGELGTAQPQLVLTCSLNCSELIKYVLWLCSLPCLLGKAGPILLARWDLFDQSFLLITRLQIAYSLIAHSRFTCSLVHCLLACSSLVNYLLTHSLLAHSLIACWLAYCSLAYSFPIEV